MKNREPHLKKPVCSVVHKVSAGETLYRIARRYGVDYGRLMALNGITNPYNVKPGMEICIPPVSGTDSGSDCAGYYIISEGDTLYRIAKNFGISLESLMAASSDVDPSPTSHVGIETSAFRLPRILNRRDLMHSVLEGHRLPGVSRISVPEFPARTVRPVPVQAISSPAVSR